MKLTRNALVGQNCMGKAIRWFLLLVIIIVATIELFQSPTKDVSEPVRQTQHKVLYVKGSVVNVREGPSTQFTIVTKLKKGYRVTEVLREGDWVKVTLDTGKAAWIHASLLSAKLQVGSGDRITILTAENRARLCPRPDCGEGRELLRMPTNTKLRVLGSYTQHQPIFDVTWYKVKYQEKEGWVSEFNTDKARDVTQRR